jgi:hypothetical protein
MIFQQQRKLFTGFMLVLCLLLPVFASFAGAQEITTPVPVECPDRTVCNGDFEEDLMHWGRFHASTSVVPGRNGSGMRIQWNDPQSVVYQVLPGVFEAGKTYEATAWFQAESSETCQLSFGDSWVVNDPENNPSGENEASQALAGNGAWQQLRVELTLDRDERLQITLSSSNVGGSVLFDDIQVRELPSLYAEIESLGLDIVNDPLHFPTGSTSESFPVNLGSDFSIRTPENSAVPEPSTLALVGLGIITGLWLRKRRTR